MNYNESTKKELIKKAKNSVIDFNDDEATNVAIETIRSGVDPIDVIEEGFIEGMKTVGDRFEEGKLSLMEILTASKTMNMGIEILKPAAISAHENSCFFGNIMLTL
ncbi:B12-binding domain-containing protein [Methanolobus mangrovi]|uniref:B12-binding domain-containing protein n=1 Tax=Methanolobus mangrovi TaxID=3072977 RepID=A0AA51UIE4_9EURY|nr:B12-binding domain-containing protein [Methanolobus mangrovi]WMW22271.1 B12-binding domain-containing protein [Methanolobus mangrovi]